MLYKAAETVRDRTVFAFRDIQPTCRGCARMDVNMKNMVLMNETNYSPFGKLSRPVMIAHATHLFMLLILMMFIKIRKGSAQIWPTTAVNVSSPRISPVY